jgi:F-type H+-transporting ATPase subunit epsilon
MAKSLLKNMKTFKLQILTPNKKIFEGEVISLVVPTKEGQLTILNNHTPIVSVLSLGEVKITSSSLSLNKGTETEKSFYLQGGVLEVKQGGEVSVLADREIDMQDMDNLEIKDKENLEKEIEESKKRAVEAMKNKDDIFTEIETENVERLMYSRKKGRNI